MPREPISIDLQVNASHDLYTPKANRCDKLSYWAVALSALCSIGAGCQSFGSRNGDNLGDHGYDDWAIHNPSANQHATQVPRPSAYANRRAQSQVETPKPEATPEAEVAAAEPPAAPEVVTASAEIPQPPAASENADVSENADAPAAEAPVVEGPVAEGPVKVSLSDLSEPEPEDVKEDAAKTEEPKNDGSKDQVSELGGSDPSGLNVIDAGVDEIDFEGALAELPAPYRELLRRQLLAAQSNGGSSDSSQVRASDDAKSGEAKSGEGPASKAGTSSAEEKSSSKVAIKANLSDSSTVQSDHSSIEPELLAASEGNSQPGSGEAVQSNEDGSAVQVAAATLPVDRAPLAETPSAESQSISHAHWNQALAQSIDLLQKQIAETPASDENLRFHHEIALRMLFVAARRLDEACTPIQGMAQEENDYLRYQMQALYEASNPDAMPVRSRHLSLVMNSQREATNHLAAASNLEVRSAAFCTEVERYGVVTKFPKYQFVEDQEVLLYCEIENVAAKQRQDGFETQLQGSYEILNDRGERVSEQVLPMEPDFCQNHRRDYFIVYQIYMPQQIPPGNYKLRLTIEDMNARKFGQSTLDFQIKK